MKGLNAKWGSIRKVMSILQTNLLTAINLLTKIVISKKVSCSFRKQPYSAIFSTYSRHQTVRLPLMTHLPNKIKDKYWTLAVYLTKEIICHGGINLFRTQNLAPSLEASRKWSLGSKKKAQILIKNCKIVMLNSTSLKKSGLPLRSSTL